MSQALHFVCPSCHQANRLPSHAPSKNSICMECRQTLFSGNVINVDEQQFKTHIEQDGMPVIADFWASWCAPCIAVAPIYKKLAEDYASQIQFLKVDTDEYQKLAGQYQIRGLPTFIIFKSGIEIDRQSGAKTIAQFRTWLQTAL